MKKIKPGTSRPPKERETRKSEATGNSLRQRAERQAGRMSSSLAALLPKDEPRLAHELQVHQIELEMQNEELRQAKADLEVSHARYVDLYDMAPVGYCTLNRKGLIVEVNLCAAKLLGVNRNKLINQPLASFIVPEDQDSYSRYLNDLLETGERQIREVRMLRRGADSFCSRMESVTGIDSHGAPVYRLIVSDVTEHKRLHEHLIRTEKLAALGMLLAAACHEINNPAHIITLNSDVLTDIWKDLTPILERHLKEYGEFSLGRMQYAEVKPMLPALIQGVKEGAHRISRIVRDLKQFAASEPADMSQEVDINEVVRSALSLLAHPINCATTRLSVSYGRNVEKIRGNTLRLEQAMANLLQNAYLALSDRTNSICVETEYKEDGRVNIIRITDEGVGMSAEVLAHMAEPFFTTRRETGGTGLGLSVSHGIIREHGGTLRFESQLGKGTKVTVILPVALEPTSCSKGNVMVR